MTGEIGRCSSRHGEFIGGLRQAKKIFVLEAVHADKAVLCPYLRCDRPGGELEVLVNGGAVRVTLPEKREYWEDAWTRVPIAADGLRVGENEVVFRAVGEGRRSLLAKNSIQPNRSLLSEDGEQTWRSDDLGDNNRADGEYGVRLWLDQSELTGEACSEPIDLPGLVSEGGVAPRGQVRWVRLTTEAERPAATSETVGSSGVCTRARTGWLAARQRHGSGRHGQLRDHDPVGYRQPS